MVEMAVTLYSCTKEYADNCKDYFSERSTKSYETDKDAGGLQHKAAAVLQKQLSNPAVN